MLNLLKKKKKQKSQTVDDVQFKKATIPEPTNGKDYIRDVSLLENVTNEGIIFHSDHFEQITGLGAKKYGRAFYIKPSGYPAEVPVNWLSGLLNGEDLDLGIHIEPYDRTDAVRDLKDKMDSFETIMHSAHRRGDHHKFSEAERNFQDAKALRNEILGNQNGLFYVSISGSIYGENIQDLNQKSVSVERAMASQGIEVSNAFDEQKEGWLSSMALGTNYLKKSYRNLDSTALTAMFPHVSSKLNHEGGMPIGVYGKEYIFFNNFDRSLTNYNLGVFGESGAGKGVLVKQIIGRGFSDGIEKVAILDVEPEYVGLTRALGGVVIEIRSDKTAGLSSKINPLDIYVEKEIMNRYQVDEYIVERVNVNEKVKEAIEFFKVMKESTSPQNPHLTPFELNSLDQILLHLYRDVCGITESPDSLYEYTDYVDENGKVQFLKKYKRMPQISDVYEEIQRLIESGEKGLDEIEKVVALFIDGRSFGMFDCQTNILAPDGSVLPETALDEAPIVNFDISRLSKNGIERPLAQHVLMTWIWNRFVLNDPKTKKRVIQDEAWMMLEFPSMVNFFKLISARGRKWNVSLTLVSQRFEMFYRSPNAQDIIAQLSCVAFMKQPDTDIAQILDTFKFSDEVGNLIRTADTGDVILKAGKEIVYFLSVPTPSEWNYINTNQNIDVNTLIQKGS